MYISFSIWSLSLTIIYIRSSLLLLLLVSLELSDLLLLDVDGLFTNAYMLMLGIFILNAHELMNLLRKGRQQL